MKANTLSKHGAGEIKRILLFGFLLLLILIPQICAQGSTSLAQTYTISGRVTDGPGNGISGATVTLSGTQTGTTTTDSAGSYSFANLQAGGNYILSPSKAGQYLASSRVVNNLSSDVTVNLRLDPYVTFNIRVADALGNGVPGVAIRVNDEPVAFAQTNSFGIVNLSVGIAAVGDTVIKLVPEKPGYIFNPPSLIFHSQNGNQAVNFTGTPFAQAPIQLLLDQSGPAPDQVAALDSLLFLRDPFPDIIGADVLNLGVDRNTRLIIFVTNLQLAQGETSSSVVVNLIDSNNQSYDVAAEDVRPVANFNFTQVIFRLPNNLPAGTCTIKVKAHGQVSNSGTIRIRT